MAYLDRIAPTRGRLIALAFSLVVGVAVAAGFGFQGDRSKEIDLSAGGPLMPQPFFGKQEFAPGVVVVTYKPGVPLLMRDALAAELGLFEDTALQSPYFHRYVITPMAAAKGADVYSMMNALLRHSTVRTAELDYRLRQDQVLPNDPRFGEQYGLHNTGQLGGTVDADIDAPEAWQAAGVLPDTIVAVCDDGLQLDHPDLIANIYVNPGEIAGNGIDDDFNGKIDDVRGWDFSDNDNNVSPASGASHGVHTSGTVGAVTNNAIGVAGVARNVKVMHCRMYGGANDYFTAFTAAIDYAWQNDARVISASYNIDGYPTFFSDAVQRAGAADVIYVNSAGNNGQQNPPRQSLRTLSNNVVFVAATDRNDNKASFSNYGSLIEIAAPGVDILSTVTGSTYANNSGTSMATPHMAGACGLMRSKFPAKTAREILDRLIGTADRKASLNGLITGGRLNVNNALEEDTIPPSDPTDLQWIAYSTSSLKMRFKGSGDDGTVGQATSYEVRMSSSPINGGNFSGATPLNVTIAPVNAGVTINTELGGFAPGSTVYLGIVAVDNLGNRSNVLAGGPYTTKGVRTDTVEGSSWFYLGTGTWSITTERPNSGLRSWSDSPGGNYGNNANTSLLSRRINVPRSGSLKYSASFDLESNRDFLYCDMSYDNGTTWVNLSRLTGNSGGWKQYTVSLPTGNGFSGTSVLVRFRMTSDGSIVRDGVYLDDFFIVSTQTVSLDNMEGAVNYSGDSPWALTTARYASPTKSWTDSPAGNYANNVTLNLTANNLIDTSSLAGAQISFKAYIDTEANYDYLRVLTSVDGGAYTQQGAYTGTLTAWNAYTVAAGGGQVRIRFALTTDGSIVRDGVYVDDVSVVGEPFILVP